MRSRHRSGSTIDHGRAPLDVRPRWCRHRRPAPAPPAPVAVPAPPDHPACAVARAPPRLSPWPPCRRPRGCLRCRGRGCREPVAGDGPGPSRIPAAGGRDGHDRDGGAGNRGCSGAVDRRRRAIAASSRHCIGRTSPAQRRRTSGNYIWSDNGEKIEVNYRGEFEFTEDDTDVARMTPGGYLRIRDGGRWLGADNVRRVPADGSGNITRKFWVGQDGASIRTRRARSGCNDVAAVHPAERHRRGARVARILKTGGADGVLTEIAGSKAAGPSALFHRAAEDARAERRRRARAIAQAGTRNRLRLRAGLAADRRHRLIPDDATPPRLLRRRPHHRLRLRAAAGALLGAEGWRGRPPLAAGCSKPHVHRVGLRSGVAPRAGRSSSRSTRPCAAPFFKALATVERVRARPRAADACCSEPMYRPRRAAVRSSQWRPSAPISRPRRPAAVREGRNPVEGALSAPFFRAAARSTQPSSAAACCRRSPGVGCPMRPCWSSSAPQGISSNFERPRCCSPSPQPRADARGPRRHIDAARSSATSNRAESSRRSSRTNGEAVAMQSLPESRV